MSDLAILFPGQGSQTVGMLSDIAPEFSQVRDTFEEASSALNIDLWDITQNNPEDKLNQTQYTQPALLTASIALWRILRATEDITPSVLAGHSLGEYSALVCAESLDFADAVRMVSQRGQFMQAAVPVGEGAMAAIIGLDTETVTKVCDQAAQGRVVTPANFNAHGQIVVAGHLDAVIRAISLANDAGAKIAKQIPVSVPSHCALMQPAAERLASILESITIKAAKIPVIQNVDALDHIDVSDIKNNLIAQLESSVRWVETIEHICERGIQTAIECGPGRVLAGLNKRINTSLNTINIGSLEGITTYLEHSA